MSTVSDPREDWPEAVRRHAPVELADLAARWRGIFAAHADLCEVRFRFDHNGAQGKVYVTIDGCSGSDGHPDPVYVDLSELTETWQVPESVRRRRFAIHRAVWDELAANPPLSYRWAAERHQGLVVIDINAAGIAMMHAAGTNWWPPDDHDALFAPWSARHYPIDDATLRAVGLRPHPTLPEWPRDPELRAAIYTTVTDTHANRSHPRRHARQT